MPVTYGTAFFRDWTGTGGTFTLTPVGTPKGIAVLVAQGTQSGADLVTGANWGGHGWTFWQYTDGVHGPAPHRVDGVGRCDRNKFNGSLAQLKKLWGVTRSR